MFWQNYVMISTRYCKNVRRNLRGFYHQIMRRREQGALRKPA